LTLRDYVHIVARHWIVLAVAVAIGLVTAGTMALTVTPTYTASTQVLFTGHATTGGQDLAYAGSYVQSRMQTYKRVGTSSSVMNVVVKTLGSDKTPEELADGVEIEVSQLNTVATVSATEPSAKEAARTANTVARVLIATVGKVEAEDAATDQATVEGIVTGPATIPDSPSDPRLLFYLLVGLVAGAVVGLGVVSVRGLLTGSPVSSPPKDS
jgi:capsular polysaccharide biosynthesis protein